MKTAILLFCLLGSTHSLPQFNPALELAPTKQAPDQETPLNQQQPTQVFPALSLIPLTQMLTLLNPAAGMTPGAQTLPLTLEKLDGQQQLQPQILPIIVAQLGAQGTILSSEEVPAAPHIFTGLLLHPLFTSQTSANADGQDEVLPTGQAGVNPAIRATPADDDLGVTTPAGIQRSTPVTEETTSESPKGIQ
ncbi:amelotin [Lepus europaeus]|uniref:amelotin n=1 Tax=Lepus europaeus TaxID=9983 RepID=UPI002B4A16AC|nr:amelotin [Lepus europaeus]